MGKSLNLFKTPIIMRNLYLVFVILFLSASCTRNAKEIFVANDKIIIISDPTTTRGELGLLIDKISKCNPKVIGLNAVFLESRDILGDTALANALKRAKNVILPTNIVDDKLVRSHQIFTDNCQGEGVMDFSYDETFSSYKPYTTFDWSYPVTIVSYYDPEFAASLMDKTIPDREYDVSYSGPKNQFKVYQMDSIDCANLNGKIVLVGYTGPDADDIVPTPWDEKGTYKTIVLAKLIANLLEGQY
jgi:hypothetical protein